MRYAIIGSGIASLSACEAIRAADGAASIRVYSPEPRLFYSRPGLPYLLARALPERELSIRTPEEIRDLGIDHVSGVVSEIVPAAHEIAVNGSRAGYDRLLIATGAASIPVEVPGADVDGVMRVDSLSDARSFLKRARWTDSAVVVGGGSTAVEMAEALRAHGIDTHYFLRGSRFWSRTLDADESVLIHDALCRHGIKLHFETEVAEIVATRGAVAGVRTANGEVVKAQIVVTAIGVTPRVDLARAAGLKTDRGILVNEHLATSVPDVFAAGDAAQVRDPQTGNAQLDTLWHSALEQGRHAGLNMAGVAQAYRKPVPLNVTRLGGITISIIGRVGSGHDPDIVTLTRGQSERWIADPDAWALTQTRAADRVRVMIGARSIVGAVVVGDQQYTPTLLRAIERGTDIFELRAALAAAPKRAFDILLGHLT